MIQEFNERKFKSLVHYICHKSEIDRLGAIKLNKILWYSDVLSFFKYGTSITGATYIKRQYGPVPKLILPTLDALQREGSLLVRKSPLPSRMEWEKCDYVSMQDPDLDSFTAKEISIVDTMLSHICTNHTATSISLASHDKIWELAEIGEEIPLTAMLASRYGEIDENDITWAKSIVSTRVA